ncbi:MAG: ribosome recycling factor [Myxococcota bacterium]
MLDSIVEDLTENFEATLVGLRRELSKLRTGRANLAMLDGVRVENYGAQVPLNQVATLKVSDPRMITVSPWDKSMITPIERAISLSDLGFNPSNDGTIIRIPIPQLTGDRRKELAKLASRIGEDHKVSLRNHRRDANDMIKELEKDGEITEDDMHRAYGQVNDLTSSYNAKIDEILAEKEQDIMAI